MKQFFTLLFVFLTMAIYAQKSKIYLTAEAQIWQNYADFSTPDYFSYYGSYFGGEPSKGVSQTAGLTVGMEQNGKFRLHTGLFISQMHHLIKASETNLILATVPGVGSIIDINLAFLPPRSVLNKSHVTSLEIPVGFDVLLFGKGKWKLWTSWRLSPTFIIKQSLEVFDENWNGQQNEPYLPADIQSNKYTSNKVKLGGGYIHTALSLEYSINDKTRLHLAPRLAIVEHRDKDFFYIKRPDSYSSEIFETSTLAAKNWGGSIGVSRFF